MSRAVGFLLARQAPSGSFGSVATADGVAEAIGALVAGGAARAPVERALRVIERDGPARARETAGRAGRIVLGLLAAGKDPRAFAGTDYVGMIDAHRDELSGEFDHTNLYSNALAALAWVSAGEQLSDRSRAFLRANACPDGGFGWRTACAGGADTDTTAVTIMLLVRAGGEPGLLARSRAWLIDARHPDGGYGQPGQPTNANSTGLALSAVAALGEDPTNSPWSGDGTGPLAALLALQTPDGGFRYLAGEQRANDYATVQAIPGAAGVAWPIRPRSGDAPAPAPTRETLGLNSPAPTTSTTTRAIAARAAASPTAGAEASDEAARAPGGSPSPVRAASRSPFPYALAGICIATAGGMLAARVVTRRRPR